MDKKKTNSSQELYREQETKVYTVNEGSFITATMVNHLDNGECGYRLHCYQNGKVYTLEGTKDDLGSMVKKLMRYYPSLEHSQVNEIKQHLKQIDIACIQGGYHGLGFIKNKQGQIGGYAGAQTLNADGKAVTKDIYADLPGCQGSTEAVVATLNGYMRGRYKRHLVVLFSLASTVSGILDRNALINLVGESSTGKTTAARLGMSLFSQDNYPKLYKSFSATVFALVRSLSNINGIPFLVDDSQLIRKNTSIQDIIYQMYNGRSVDRLVKGQELTETLYWATAIIMTSEKSLLDKCKDSGVLPRLFELHVQDSDLFDNAEHANQIQQFIKNEFGCAGTDFAQHVMKLGQQAISQMYDDELSYIRKNVDSSDHLLARCCETIALITLTAKLADNSLGLQVDEAVVMSLMLETCRSNIYRFFNRDKFITAKLYRAIAEKLPPHLKDGESAVLGHDDLKPVMSRLCNETCLTEKTIKEMLHDAGLMEKKGSSFSNPHTIDGKSVRDHKIIKNDAFLMGGGAEQ